MSVNVARRASQTTAPPTAARPGLCALSLNHGIRADGATGRVQLIHLPLTFPGANDRE
jgi:hypothetical protein